MFQSQKTVEKTPEASRSGDEGKYKGFERGLEPERIIGATESHGELLFLMKWLVYIWLVYGLM